MSQSIETTVKNYLKPYVIKKYLKSTIDSKRCKELRHYAELAGFTNTDTDTLGEVDEQISNKILQNAREILNLNIVLKTPPFPRNSEQVPQNVRRAYYSLGYNPELIRLPDRVSSITKTKRTLLTFGKVIQYQEEEIVPQYLMEIPPEKYAGKVPLNALETAGKATELNLIPRVWIAGTLNEIRNAMVRQVDPIIVGYPIVSKGDKEKSPVFRTTHCLLLAAWGTDLNLIDNYFSQS